MRESESKWNARATARKASDRNQITHAAIVITNVLCCCCCSNYLLAINLHITATLHSIGIPYLSNYHGTSSHVLHSLELDVDTNYLEPKVSKPNGLVRSGDRYRDGDIESAREWVVLLLSCLCLSLPSHTVDRPLSEERSSSVRPGISSSSIRVKLIFDSSVLPRRS
jgi:hypothetical protein